MDIFDSRYFRINKKLLKLSGLWPYEERQTKFIRRLIFAVIITSMVIPHFIGIYVNCGIDNDKLVEHIGVIMYILIIAMKLISYIVYESKLKALYDDIPINWKAVTDKKEKKILMEYSENGRVLTIGYNIYLIATGLIFIAMPLYPKLLNALNPSSTPLPNIYIIDGEFLVNKDEVYWQIYFFDLAAVIISINVVGSCDSMYAASIEHCLGLFAIIKHRLQMNKKLVYDESHSSTDDLSYNWMLDIIRIHLKALQFTNILELTYSRPFFFTIGGNLLFSSIVCVMILINTDQTPNLIRYMVLSAAGTIHLFYISWPGQKLIDHSSGLYQAAYFNEWYESSNRSKKLLRFFTLRCFRPCLLTAGGIYIMNFENFLSVMKKSVSFIAVFSSLR